jgi:hypothetical protein
MMRRRVSAGASAVLFAGVRRPRRIVRAPASISQRRNRESRFKGMVFNLLTFFAPVPRRNRKLPKRYILHAAPPPRRRPSVAAAAAVLFARVNRPKVSVARAAVPAIKIFRSIRRFIGNIVGPPIVVPPVIIHAPVVAVAQIAAPITDVCVIHAPVQAVARIHARVRR